MAWWYRHRRRIFTAGVLLALAGICSVFQMLDLLTAGTARVLAALAVLRLTTNMGRRIGL